MIKLLQEKIKKHYTPKNKTKVFIILFKIL